MNKGFICPICAKKLVKKEKSFLCENGHCFDISKYGYVNLLTKSGKKGHGDDKLMVNARHNFLNKGYYEHLREAIYSEAGVYMQSGCSVLDSGCGEGYYTERLYTLFEARSGKDFYGIDISKDALKTASKACPKVTFAVASAYSMPFEDNSFDMLISLFAPFAKAEFLRVIKQGGFFITAIPLEEHLYSLKKAVYAEPYRNKPENTDLTGFQLISSVEVKKKIDLICNADIQNLFMMTPYYYKTSKRDQEKISLLNNLTVETEFLVLTYKKK